MAKNGLVEFDAVLAIARHGSFRAAALELGLSATALSHAIAKLEGQLGVRLFNRTTRSVSLTDAGRHFVEQVGPAVRTLHDAMGAARSQQETPSGTLRINAFASGGREILAPLLLTFLRRYPQVHIDLVTEERIVDIVAEGFDLGLRSANMVPTDMIAIPVSPPRSFAVVASPAYLAANGTPRTPPDLMGHACLRIRLPNGALHRWHFEKGGESVSIDVAGPITLDESSLSRIAVLDHVGVGYFMEADVRDDIRAGHLVRLLEDWTPPLSPLCLYYPTRRNPSAAFRALIEMARASTA
ncbi:MULTISPECIES: LysR family transcriptional regulator [Sphingomonas]|uniref:LysR family transcriptional regulator n=1 Tax=Sphingomonas adhaesiva TaxID=28212 RepID=A0A2A4IAJ1_9SPHN|nr:MULTISPECIES: LysR family transcriptional regulator [Sphingomonas]PCG15196.1 LysR family transcriptional regulator [Sphingomonas adhaesiva]PZU79988.1 MAG: LysR family transcriptional regulator [Sphingomonas sp.]